MITNHMVDLVYDQWHHLLIEYNHNILSLVKLVQYANAIHEHGAALDDCWGVVDGTVRPV